MTWSILARDLNTGEIGVAVATKFLAVGGLCPYGHGQYGVIATQALVNPLFGGRGLRLLAEDYSAVQVLAMLLLSDEGREMRQLHLMDRFGHIAQHTGNGCQPWCGSIGEVNVSVSGNRLAGPHVVQRTHDVYIESLRMPFAKRLLVAMEAGDAAGGDKWGKQSAALRIWKGEEYTSLDLRADDHPDPLSEVRRLYCVARERYIPFSTAYATKENPTGMTDLAEIEARVERARKLPGSGKSSRRGRS